ncbi:MAG: ABC transporter permease subunit, partial [Acidimicrobiia bacterium]
MIRLAVERRPKASPLLVVAVPLASVAVALAVAGVFLLLTGHHPLEVYGRMVSRSFGSVRNLTETLVSATPLILTGLAAAVAFKMLVWNIGGEGQLYLGAIGAAGVAILLGEGAPAVVALPAAVAAGAVAGAMWAALAAVPRVLSGTNEILTTLMLNFVALNLMNYLIFGSPSPWRDPTATNFPQGRPIPEGATLPALVGRLHWGFLV